MRLNYKQIRVALSERREFQGNSMWATNMRTDIARIQLGHLSRYYSDLLDDDLRTARRLGHESIYVVFSYGTPIGWAYGDVVRVPEDRYSVTSSRHQGMLYALQPISG